ncbi:MAG: oligoendopeptidase F [Acidobacteria bacterium]|uniref:Oligopeptidase F n=1 Tax=Candidatus Sulfomarinibacter kjeldsenii TaxID=2885994 RepID=A0A8J6XW62_9BACT|nr:oligoendopeptidase F [Candidatus Sulfomarinibacter kjeldsenii]
MTPENALKPDARDRAEIPEEYTWDLDQIYSDWEAWEAGLDGLQNLMDSYQKLKGTLSEGPQRILEASQASDELGQLAYRVYQYPGLMQSQDTRDNAVQARLEQVRLALAAFRQATAWYTPELLDIPEEMMQDWLDKTPELAPYRFGIEESYRMQRHVLDEDGERLLAFASTFGGTPAQTYSMMADADVDFPTVTLSDGSKSVASHANLSQGLHTLRDQVDREKLFKAHFSVYDGYPNTYASIYNGVLQKDWFTARSRRYESALDAKLDDDNIPATVVENLIDTARTGGSPLQRYHRLRRATLGLERYRYFDAYLPLVEIEWALPYDTVGRLIIDSVAIFGEEYQRTVQRSFDERWIDVYENEGKRSGAFSAGVYGVHPYMLLNYADTLNDAFTVAHEMGHTMHTVLSHESQPFATSSYSIFVAEVASMANESLFLDRLLAEETDPARRVTLLQHAIDDIAAGFYRQAMFADFELRAHRIVEENHPITAEVLQETYLEVLKSFFADALDDQDWYRNTWARIPHFYGSPYYVFQYATSKAAASLIHRRMTEGNAGECSATVEAYLELLRSGGNDHPISQLQKAGVDFTTTEPTEALVAEMDSLVDRLELELTRLSG